MLGKGNLPLPPHKNVKACYTSDTLNNISIACDVLMFSTMSCFLKQTVV